jgi:ribosomal protein S18 acetylase RimI-like enzyme
MISELLQSQASEKQIKTFSYAQIQEAMPQILTVETNVYSAHRAIYDTSPWQAKNFLNELPEKEMYSAFLIHQGVVKGFSIAYEFQPGYCHISRVAIHTEIVGKGLGTQLLQSQLDRMAANGISTCSIDLKVENVPACIFYTKLGFKRLTDKTLEEYVELKSREVNEYLGNSPSHIAMILTF